MSQFLHGERTGAGSSGATCRQGHMVCKLHAAQFPWKMRDVRQEWDYTQPLYVAKTQYLLGVFCRQHSCRRCRHQPSSRWLAARSWILAETQPARLMCTRTRAGSALLCHLEPPRASTRLWSSGTATRACKDHMPCCTVTSASSGEGQLSACDVPISTSCRTKIHAKPLRFLLHQS